MIERGDILSIAFLKKMPYTGCCQGMRYRMEKKKEEDKEVLLVTIWPEPFSFARTPEESKERNTFDFMEDGIVDAIGWMNNRLFEDKQKWEQAKGGWKQYSL